MIGNIIYAILGICCWLGVEQLWHGNWCTGLMILGSCVLTIGLVEL